MALQGLTFLEIVNRAITESKATLDELTSVNFATPPRTILYNHFKNWVNDAYVELAAERPEWFFRRERALVSIRPRLFLKDVSVTLLVGDVLVGDISGVVLTVEDTHDFEEIEENLASEITVSVSVDTTAALQELIRGETLSRTSLTPGTAIATLVGLGRYDFQDLVPTLDLVDPYTIQVHPPVDDVTVNYGTLGTNKYRVIPVEHRHWSPEYDLFPWTSGYPKYITQTDQGTYAIYPQPDEEMLLSFEYTRELQRMSVWDDVPEALPADKHMYLVWKAIEEFADFDNNAGLWKRANKHVKKYEYSLYRDQLPQLKWAPSKFNGG